MMINNKSDEILSAFMDIESSAFESRFCIKELLRSEAKRSRWERYHLVRDALQGNLPAMMDKDFCTRVMEQIEVHRVSDIKARQSSHGFKYLRSLSSVAIAASMAVLMVWGVRWFLGSQPIPQPLEVANVKTPLEVTNVKTSTDRGSAGPKNIDSRKGWYVDAKAEARMNSYLVNHAEYAARKDVMPYVRIVGFDMATPR